RDEPARQRVIVLAIHREPEHAREARRPRIPDRSLPRDDRAVRRGELRRAVRRSSGPRVPRRGGPDDEGIRDAPQDLLGGAPSGRDRPQARGHRVVSRLRPRIALLARLHRCHEAASRRVPPPSPSLLAVELLPPLAGVGLAFASADGVDLLPDVLDRPARECREVAGLPLGTDAKRLAIALGRLALNLSLPRMLQDVASLEIVAVAGLLEDEILGEARGVVADVEASHED